MAKIFKNAAICNENTVIIEIEEPLESQVVIENNDEALKNAYEKGLADGLRQNEAHLAPLTEHLEKLLASIPKTLAEARLTLQTEIADIVLMIISQYFVSQAIDHQLIESQINQILNQLNGKEQIELLLHPQDIALLQEEAIVLKASFLHGIKIKSDDTLRLGGCIIKTNQGTFNASIEQQIDQLKIALLKLKQGGHHASPI